MLKEADYEESQKVEGAMKTRPRSVMTYHQAFFYVVRESAGMLLGLLLHLGRRSRREDETWKVLEPILLSEMKLFMVLELVVASAFNYFLVRRICQNARKNTRIRKRNHDGENGIVVQQVVIVFFLRHSLHQLSCVLR